MTMTEPLSWIYDDGGRAAAGFRRLHDVMDHHLGEESS